MQLPNDCLLDSKINEISSVVSNLARYNQPSEQPEKIQIADIEALIASSSFSIASNSNKNEVQEASTVEAPTANSSIETITHQDNVKKADTKNVPISVEVVDVVQATKEGNKFPAFFYGEKEIENMVDNLTEDEQDSLIEEISVLVDDWTNSTDLQLKRDLETEYKKSKNRDCDNWYENWLWDKAQVEVYRKYVIEFIEGQGYIYKAEADLLENQETPKVEVKVNEVNFVVESQVENTENANNFTNKIETTNINISTPKNNNFELLGNIANKCFPFSTIRNTDQNVANSIEDVTDKNVAELVTQL